MSNSPLDKNKTDNKSDVQFTTENIGRWASRQEDPFAEQNRQKAVKKQERNRKRQKIAPIFVIIASIVLAALAIVGLIFLIIHLTNRTVTETPKIEGGTVQDISDYRDILQNFYNQNASSDDNEKFEEIQDMVNNTLSTKDGQEHAVAVKIAQANFYMDNGRYEESIRIAEEINPEDLDLEQQQVYYSILYYNYAVLGNLEKANEYSAILYDIVDQMGGIGG